MLDRFSTVISFINGIAFRSYCLKDVIESETERVLPNGDSSVVWITRMVEQSQGRVGRTPNPPHLGSSLPTKRYNG